MNTISYFDQSALIFAYANGYCEVVKLLLEAGADSNLIDYYERTALLYAISNRDAEMVSLLLEAGDDPNLQSEDCFGTTALILASQNGDIEIVRRLLPAGANFKAKDGLHKKRALSYAVRNGHSELASLLRKAKADAESQS